MTDEQQIAALREEIRRGSWKFALPAVICGCLAIAVFFGLSLANLALHLDQRPRGRFDIGVLGGVASSLLADMAVILFASWLWVIRRAMRRFSPPAPTDVRFPLLTGPGEKYPTRELADALRLEMRHPTELAPATAPDARGDEASPAESELCDCERIVGE